MKKIMTFAAGLAIALAAAKFDQLGLFYSGILLLFAYEYVYYCTYDLDVSIEKYESYRNTSRKMVGLHTVWCISTICFAAMLGFLGGYDKLVEYGAGSNYSYETVHVDGFDWVTLVMLLMLRVLVQVLIESAINKNIETAKRRQLYNA